MLQASAGDIPHRPMARPSPDRGTSAGPAAAGTPVHVRIATRASPLALWQAERAKSLIERAGDTTAELVPMTTEGDRKRETPLAESGGKGLFVKELEAALSEGRADIAIHSMKDVPSQLPPGFAITTLGARADPRDALVAGKLTFDTLPDGARVGSSSPRRCAQILFARPDLVTVPVRGNVGTRLAKLADGDIDALVLACAGLDRLGQADHISQRLDVDLCVPAPGQGALAAEYPEGQRHLAGLLAACVDQETQSTVTAERALTTALGADCTTPLGAYATLHQGTVTLRAVLLAPDGEQAFRVTETGTDPLDLGERVADALLRLGAMASLRQGPGPGDL